MSLVNVSIVGNVVKPPVTRQFTDKQVTTLIVGVKSPTKQKADNSDFYKVEVWGRLSEIASQYVSKGSQIGVTGRLILEQWQDKEGRMRTTAVVKADQLSLPPKGLRVVGDDQAEQNATATMTGEIEFADEDTGDIGTPVDRKQLELAEAVATG